MIDAFCPECREDLSLTPQEARETAKGAFNALMGIGSPEEEKTKRAFSAIIFTGLAAIGLLVAVIEKEWDKAFVAGFALIVCAIWVFSVYQSFVVRTSVTGSGKTPKDSEQPQ